MPSAYIIANVTITNPAQYAEYRRLSSLAMQAHGAEVCVRGGAVEVLEGDWRPDRLVVLKFPSVEQARAFNESVEYTAARQARQGAAVMRMVLVEGHDEAGPATALSEAAKHSSRGAGTIESSQTKGPVDERNR